MYASSLRWGDRPGEIHVVGEAEETVALCLEGDFDIGNASVVSAHINDALESESNLIVDLSEATFIDSSIIHVLIRASETAGQRGRILVLQLGTAAIVERTLEVTKVERVLLRAHDRQEALRIIEQQATRV